MTNAEIRKLRAILDSDWKDFCWAARRLQELQSRVRFVKKLNPEFKAKYLDPAQEHFDYALIQLSEDARE